MGGIGGRDEEETDGIQNHSSKSYLWDVFLYLRLTEKTNKRKVRPQVKCYSAQVQVEPSRTPQ